MRRSTPPLTGFETIPSLVDQIEPRMRSRSDDELRALTGVFRERIRAGEALDSLLPEAFALVREAAHRTIGQRHLRVQLIAGAALHAGRIALMRDGEGKTLTATLPAYLNALTGRGVHIVGLSDDLARRDAERMGAIYRLLGLEVGALSGQATLAERREVYAADITYAAHHELAFDYLRDNMALSVDEMVQRGRAFAIVDEADAILVHQALAEHTISGPGQSELANEERVTYAGISTRGYLRLYDKLAGMTGTAATEAAELERSYQLDVADIPTNKPLIRADQLDDIHTTAQAKFEALARTISQRHPTGQPILIGVSSAETAERIAGLLDERGISHTVLDAEDLELEELTGGLAQAGRLGAVTILRGMARGVELPLGGALDQPAEAMSGTEREQVIEAGGLLVLGVERHWSRSRDQRLRAWAGRRGEPGESKFILSREDPLLRGWSSIFGQVEALAKLLRRGVAPIQGKLAMGLVGRIQRVAEARWSERRGPLLEFDEIIDGQRETIYATRRQILNSRTNDLHDQARSTLYEVIQRVAAQHCPRDVPTTRWDRDGLVTALAEVYPTGLRSVDLEAGPDSDPIDSMELERLLISDAKRAYAARQAEFSADVFTELERAVLFNALDRHWREHLRELAILRDGLESRSADRSQALAGSRQEASDLFQRRQERIGLDTVHYLFNAQVTFAEQA
jgi:preprotein translocase subunit SecA